MNGIEVTDLILTERQIKAGLKVIEDDHWLVLVNIGGGRIATFGNATDKQFIQEEADRYLMRIDYNE